MGYIISKQDFLGEVILKQIAVILIFTFFTAALCCGKSVESAPETTVGNLILASVNGNVITESDVLPLTRNREKQAKAVYSGERLSKEIYNYRKEVVNELIDNILVQAEFDRFKYPLSKQEIEREIDRFGERIGCRSREQLLRRLSKDGSTMEELQLRVRKNLMVQIMLFRQFRIADPVSPREVFEYFKAHQSEYASPEKVGLAMLKLDSSRSDLDKISAEINEELKSSPEHFAALVRRYNPEFGNVELGEIDSKLLRPEFASAFKEFKVGLTAGPIKVYDGVVWLKITSYKPAEKAVYSLVEEKIKSDLERKKREKILADYIQRLRSVAVIKYFL